MFRPSSTSPPPVTKSILDWKSVRDGSLFQSKIQNLKSKIISGDVAQQELEHLATNEKVVGSSPSVFTIRFWIRDLGFWIGKRIPNPKSKIQNIDSGSSNRQDAWLWTMKY